MVLRHNSRTCHFQHRRCTRTRINLRSLLHRIHTINFNLNLTCMHSSSTSTEHHPHTINRLRRTCINNHTLNQAATCRSSTYLNLCHHHHHRINTTHHTHTTHIILQ
jgi:hypothetical protein